VQCDNGLVHRPAPGTCAPYEPNRDDRGASELPGVDECRIDADCTERAYGFCVPGISQYGTIPTANRCEFGCTVDAECDAGFICVCTETRGECRPSNCTTNADCGAGAFCAECAAQCRVPSGFACQSTADECQIASDCLPSLDCAPYSNGGRRCTLGYCAS
jgi:hypothetical protein